MPIKSSYIMESCFLDDSCDIALILEDDVILNKNFDDLLSR